MNTRTRKEIRHLLPAFAISIASLLPIILWPNWSESGVLAAALFILGCLIMAAETFGLEFRQRTMPLLLSQPIPRPAIWRKKMCILGLALGFSTIVIAIYVFRPWLFSGAPISGSGMAKLGVCIALVPLCAFCATPWMTLALRNTLLGTLLSFAAPCALISLNVVVHDWLRIPNTRTGDAFAPVEISIIAVLGLYCIASVRLGFLRFQKLEVIEGGSKDLEIPHDVEIIVLHPLKRLFHGFSGPLASLIKKELRLQLVPFMLAAVFCAVAVLAAILYPFHFLAGKANLAEIIFGIACSVYVFLIPFLVGAISVAEEKAWGIAEWHMTLPPSVRKQWLAKMLVALPVSLVLGLLLPFAAGWTAHLLFGDSHVEPPSQSGPSNLAICLSAGAGHLLITSVVVYAACLMRSTIAAILLAFALMLVFGFGINFHFPPDAYWNKASDPWTAFLFLLMAGTLALFYIVQRAAYICYRVQRPRLRVAVSHIAAMFIVCTLLGRMFSFFMTCLQSAR